VSGASVENKANGKGEVVCQVPEGPSHVAQPPSAGITAGAAAPHASVRTGRGVRTKPTQEVKPHVV